MSFTHDAREALRQWRREPDVTAVAILSLSIAIGANTALVSIVDALLLRPLSIRAPPELVHVREATEARYDARVWDALKAHRHGLVYRRTTMTRRHLPL